MDFDLDMDVFNYDGPIVKPVISTCLVSLEKEESKYSKLVEDGDHRYLPHLTEIRKVMKARIIEWDQIRKKAMEDTS
jgi:hypothetical protein